MPRANALSTVVAASQSSINELAAASAMECADALVADAEDVSIATLTVKVLSLERLIAVKRKLTRPKDQLMLLQLEATLDERRKTGRS